MAKNTLYIAYGSNLNAAQMMRRCPTAQIYGTGRLQDYRLDFKALGSCAYATVVPCQGETVPIAVWDISREDELSLDRYEGYPTHYTKKIMKVTLEDSVVEGMIYVMNPRAVSAQPASSYFQCILSGYDRFGFEGQKLYDALGRAKEEGYCPLQFYRHKCGLTQKQLAEKAGVSVKSIQNYECGERDIKRARADTVLRLAQVLEVLPYLLLK